MILGRLPVLVRNLPSKCRVVSCGTCGLPCGNLEPTVHAGRYHCRQCGGWMVGAGKYDISSQPIHDPAAV